MQQYRIRCHKKGNIAAFTIKNFTKDQLFLTEYLQNKLHSFNELIYFPKNQGFYRILKQKQVVFDTTFQKWEGNNGNKRSYHTDAPCCFRRLYIFGIGDLKITILNPGIETLTKMGKKWLYHLKQINSNNIEITRDPLFDAAFEGFLLNNEKNIEFKQENISYSSEDLDWLDKYAEYKDIEMDSKITNCSSIALLIDYKDIKMLFPGDSPIQLFENELPKILDVIKLPHHGSAKNISLEFIKNTKVKYYLLSTDGKRYIDHPGKAVIANIIKNTGNNTELIKNYEIKFLKGLGKLDAED